MFINSVQFINGRAGRRFYAEKLLHNGMEAGTETEIPFGRGFQFLDILQFIQQRAGLISADLRVA